MWVRTSEVYLCRVISEIFSVNSWLVAKNKIFDPQKSNRFILESKWGFVAYLKKSPRGVNGNGVEIRSEVWNSEAVAFLPFPSWALPQLL